MKALTRHPSAPIKIIQKRIKEVWRTVARPVFGYFNTLTGQPWLKKACAPLKRWIGVHRTVWPRIKPRISKAMRSVTVGALLITMAIGPAVLREVEYAEGAYTATSTDADGNTHLASNAVNDTYFYDTSTDSDPATQQKLGIDPNWKNGVTRKSYALKFDGVDDYVDAGNKSVYNFATQNSYSVWFKSNQAADANYRMIMQRYRGGTPCSGFVIDIYNGQVRTAICSDSDNLILSSNNSNYNDGIWHHVVLSMDSNSGTGYLTVDGSDTKTDSFTGTLRNYNGPLTFGSQEGSYQWSGFIDDPRIYTRVISEDEIKKLHDRQPISNIGLIGQWRFDEGSGNTALDSTHKVNTGNLKNGPSNLPAADGTANGPIWVTGSNAIMDGFEGCGPDDANCTNPSGQLGAGNVSITSDSYTSSDNGYEIRMTASPGLQFDGTDDYIDVSDPTAMLGTTQHTVSVWVKTTGTTLAMVTKLSTYFQIRVSPTGMAVARIVPASWPTNPSLDITGTTAVNDGSWHLITQTWNNGTLILYVDGKEEGRGTSPDTAIKSSTGRISIGSYIYGACPASCQQYQGLLDDARLYARPITGDEAADLYAGRTVSNTSLKGWWKLNEGSGTTAADSSGNSNTGTFMNGNSNSPAADGASNGPIWVEGAPIPGSSMSYYQWRSHSGVSTYGSWSSILPITSSPTELGSTGVKLRFNVQGHYNRYDTFRIASWAVEAFSTTSPQRGLRRSFPDKANIIVSTNGGIDIIDAQSNLLWLRAPTGNNQENSLLYFGDRSHSTTAKNGQIYIGKLYNMSPSLLAIQLDLDLIRNFKSSSNCIYGGNLSDRNDDLGSIGCVGTGVKSLALSKHTLSVAISNNKQYLAHSAHNYGYVSLGVIHDITSISQNNQTFTHPVYSRNNPQDGYSQVILTSNGYLYAINMGASTTPLGLDRWDNVFADTADQVGSTDRTYTTSSTPALRSNGIYDISVTEGTSLTETGQNTVALATDLGTEVIEEHSTQASSQVRHYVRSGNKTSGNIWNTRIYGSALSFNGSTYVNAGTGAELHGPYTLSIWIKPNDIAGATQFILGRGGGAVSWQRDYSLRINGGRFIMQKCDGSSCQDITSSGTYSANQQWYHVVGRTDGTTGYLYINGILAASGNFNMVVPSNSSRIITMGSIWEGTYQYKYDGLIDEVRLFDRSLNDSEIDSLYSGGPSDAPTAGLVGYWPLNERSGQSVYDASDNRNDGTLGANGTAAVDDPTRVIPSIAGSADKVMAVSLGKSSDSGRTIQFDGVNDRVHIGDPADGSLDFGTNSFSYGLWVSQSTFMGGWDMPWYKGGSSTGTPGYDMELGSGGWNACIADGTRNACNSIATGSAGEWHHLFGVVDRSRSVFEVYYDGIKTGSADISLLGSISTNEHAVIGSNPTQNYPMNGNVSDVRIYSKALTGSEISTIFNGRAGTADMDSGLVGWWKLNDASGTIAKDSSSAPHNGTLKNGTSNTPAADGITNGPLWTTGSPVRERPAMWVATNGAGANDGAITAISTATDQPIASYTTAINGLPDLDIVSLSTTKEGALALVGTEVGAWNPGTAGFPVDDTAPIAATVFHPVRIKGGTRIKGGARLK